MEVSIRYLLLITSCILCATKLFGQNTIGTRSEVLTIINADSDLLSLYKSKQSLSNKATKLGVISIFSAGLTGLSGVLHYESNDDTSKALTSLPVKIFGGVSIVAGLLGTIEYLRSRDKQKQIEQLLESRYNSKVELTFASCPMHNGLSLIYTF